MTRKDCKAGGQTGCATFGDTDVAEEPTWMYLRRVAQLVCPPT